MCLKFREPSVYINIRFSEFSAQARDLVGSRMRIAFMRKPGSNILIRSALLMYLNNSRQRTLI